MENWAEVLEYRENGDLVWRHRDRSSFDTDRGFNGWNKRFAGKVVGSCAFHRDGQKMCKHVKFRYVSYSAHRLVWEMHHGPIPSGLQVDHENGNPFDNRIANLRLATSAQNARNRKPHRNGTGIKGVSWHKATSKWIAQIMVDGKKFHLGCHATPELASRAYQEAASAHFGQFARA